MASDAGGGAYVSWQDQRAGWQVYATRVRGDGTFGLGWQPDGTRASPDEHNGGGGPWVVPSATGVIVFWNFQSSEYAAKLVDG